MEGLVNGHRMENVQSFVVVVNKKEVEHAQTLHLLMVVKTAKEKLKKRDHVIHKNAKVRCRNFIFRKLVFVLTVL